MKNIRFKYINGKASYDTGEVFFARLDVGASNVDNFLNSIFYLLWFPGYFGFNWNALRDCLRDFFWIKEYKIVIVHDDVPNIDLFSLKIYLDILNDAVLDWENDSEHELEVVFQEKNRETIERLLEEKWNDEFNVTPKIKL